MFVSFVEINIYGLKSALELQGRRRFRPLLVVMLSTFQKCENASELF